MSCFQCEQMRKSAARIWRKITHRQCSIPGCDKRATASLCEEHWRRLPLSLRLRYWEETDYGRRKPSQQLLDETLQALRIVAK
jgi:hypothetical protein